MVDNTHAVPASQWKKWTDHQRRTFNFLFEVMKDQDLFKHPMAPILHEDHWLTTRWNSAWMAADAAGA